MDIFLVEINYKSGKTVTSWFEKFIFEKEGESHHVEWKLAPEPHAIHHQVLYINGPAIESIWVKETKKI